MQKLDATAIQTLGIPRSLLMDHAGLALAQVVRARLPHEHGIVLVCCGTGYNGGDGLAAARHLAGWGYAVRILLAGSIDRLREEPATFARIAKRMKLPLTQVADPADLGAGERWFDEAALIVDALLGIGATGSVREPIASLVRRINASGKPIIAADVPSGLHADTGTVQGEAVKATVTVTFGCIKRGCLLHEGPAHTGELIMDPITFPNSLLGAS